MKKRDGKESELSGRDRKTVCEGDNSEENGVRGGQ